MWVLAWIGLSIFIGMAGKGKRIGFMGALFISLVLSPLVGFIVVVLSADETAKDIKTVEQAEKERAGKSTEERLFDLKELREKDILTEEEYQEQRRRIIGGV